MVALQAGPASARTAPPAQASPAPRVLALAWADCADGFQCTTAQVPLDYRNPRGRQIRLAVTWLPASDPAHREGAVFVNPGGPGISGIQFTHAAPELFTPQVRAHFDIVGFDPRGVGASTPVRCFASNAAAESFWAGVPAFPLNRSQERMVAAASADYSGRCRQRSGALLRHVSTSDTARDMDLLRAAIGDPKLNYWGMSYGSYLGEVYANLFPERVRAMALDGVVDPHAWADDTVGLLTSQSVAAGRTFTGFLDACANAGVRRCPFARLDAESGTLRDKVERILARARHGTLQVPGSRPARTITYQDMVEGIDGAMDEPGSWLALAQALQALVTNDPAGSQALNAVGIPPTPPRPGPAYDNTNDASQAVYCTDTVLPRDPRTWPVIRHRIAERGPLLSPVRLYSNMPCATWPTSHTRYAGPWNRHTGVPLLLVSVTGDPSTPHGGAQQAARELHYARLLTVNGYGHTSIHAASSCAIAAENTYLLTTRLPPAGTHCNVDYSPF